MLLSQANRMQRNCNFDQGFLLTVALAVMVKGDKAGEDD